MRQIYLIFALALFSGCTSTAVITPLAYGANAVQIATSEPSHCVRVGEVMGYKKNTNAALSLLDLRISAKNELKNQAYALGADTIVIIGTDTTSSGGGYYATRGFHPYDMGFYVPNSYPKEYVMDAVAYKCR